MLASVQNKEKREQELCDGAHQQRRLPWNHNGTPFFWCTNLCDGVKKREHFHLVNGVDSVALDVFFSRQTVLIKFPSTDFFRRKRFSTCSSTKKICTFQSELGQLKNARFMLKLQSRKKINFIALFSGSIANNKFECVFSSTSLWFPHYKYIFKQRAF